MGGIPGRERPISRRTVLLSAAGFVVGAAELGLAIDARPSEAAPTARLTDATVPTTARELVTLNTAQLTRVSTTVPPWAKRWSTPIHDLDDFVRREPGTHFPARSVMLTIDDGPSAYWTPRYLRLLQKYDVHATFNLIGEQVPSQRALVHAIASQGHVLANHTWTHDLRLPSRYPADIRSEMARTNDAIERAARVRPRIFRSPGGAWGPRIFDALVVEQMVPLGWDIDPRDWARPGTTAIETSMLQARPGDIILCHDGGGDRSETYAALARVIPALKRRGYRFVTLPQ